MAASGNLKKNFRPEHILKLEGDLPSKDLLKRLHEWQKKSIK